MILIQRDTERERAPEYMVYMIYYSCWFSFEYMYFCEENMWLVKIKYSSVTYPAYNNIYIHRVMNNDEVNISFVLGRGGGTDFKNWATLDPSWTEIAKLQYVY